MRDTRAISQAFERYHRERAVFAGSLADLARHEGNCSPIEEAGGVPLLATMLEDPVPGIRCTAAAALGRLATQSETVSNKIIADGTLHVLVKLLAAPLSEDAAKRREVLAQRKAAAFALRGTAKHGMGASRAVVEAGGLEAASASLRNSDAEAKEGIAWLFDCISSYSEDMAQAVVDADALPALVSCLDFSEVALKRAASAALGSIAQHSTACSMAVSQAGALPPLVAMLNQGENGDVRLLRNLLCALSQIVQGGPQQASEIVAAGALPAITRCLGAEDELVRRFAASALRDVMCHGQELARTTVNTPRCLQLLIESTRQAKGLNA